MSEKILTNDCRQCLGTGVFAGNHGNKCDGTGYLVSCDGKFLIQQITPITKALESIAASLNEIASRS